MKIFFLILATAVASSTALDNGLARTPPMGWMSWLFNNCVTDCESHPKQCLSEELIKRTADRMVADGYIDAGYEYIIIDDCWQQQRENGKMVANKTRFKNGMRALSDYVHSKGLKFGMYQDIGTKTCQGEPGLKGHEKDDVATFVEWQIDFLKVDGCFEDIRDMPEDYPKFGRLLNETGRPILYSCSWPAYTDNKNYTALTKYCNIWRNYDDISANWNSVTNIMDWFGNQTDLVDSAGPGHFHDPDMLVIGNPGISKDQARVQMAVWSILAAPLLMSTDLDTIKPEYKEILLNKDIIALNQCKLGKMGKRVYKDDYVQIWKRVYHEGIAIAIVNMVEEQTTYILNGEDLELEKQDYKVMDFFKEDKELDFPKNGKLELTINATGVKFYKFVPKKQLCFEDHSLD